MVMTLVAGHVIRGWGWRAAYIALGAPMILVVVPIVALVVRSRPPGAVRVTVAQGAAALEGFEATGAFRTRSFWTIVTAKFCFGFAAAGGVIHMVAYLESVGYKGGSAAFAMSMIFGFAACGKVIMRLVADRVTGRLALALDLGLIAAALLWSSA